ncbi:alpha/beta hydrolase family protein [Aurantivibrio plasticivorans]
MKKSIFSKLVVGAGALLLSSTLYASGGGSVPPVGNNPCGPDPSSSALSRTGASGPFSVATKNVSSFSASGFGGGTIHYPTNSNCGRMGGIAVVPGYVSYESSIEWWGPRLASWGFVVITINTNSIYDQPNSRADQLSAALDHIIDDSTVGSLVDPDRLGAIGWSMGGGGSLKLATDRARVRAIIPQAPWYSGSYGSMDTPAFMIACENDAIAPTSSHVDDFYRDASGPKMKIEVNNGSHYCANSGYNESLLGKPGIAWMKRYIDGDTRYNQFLCGNESYGSSYEVSDYDYASCP